MTPITPSRTISRPAPDDLAFLVVDHCPGTRIRAEASNKIIYAYGGLVKVDLAHVMIDLWRARYLCMILRMRLDGASFEALY